MDYFFRYQKSAFNLENNKCICLGNFFVYTQLDLLAPELFFELCISLLLDIYKTLKSIRKI